jgi:hypothetical protein
MKQAHDCIVHTHVAEGKVCSMPAGAQKLHMPKLQSNSMQLVHTP